MTNKNHKGIEGANDGYKYKILMLCDHPLAPS